VLVVAFDAEDAVGQDRRGDAERRLGSTAGLQRVGRVEDAGVAGELGAMKGMTSRWLRERARWREQD